MKDYYQILGVDSTADESTLKSAYRKLAKEYHPDTNKAPEAEAKFKEINEAYDVLKDATRRSQYDAQKAGMYRQPFNHSWSNGGNHFEMDLDEILRDIRRSRNPYPNDARNRDINIAYNITLEEAYTGKDAKVSYVTVPGKPATEVSFKVPAGIQDGMKLRFTGKGDDAMSHVSPGDLYIRINIVPHVSFVRMGHHLVTSVEVGYLDALLGTEVEIPTIEGKKIKMRVPAGIHPGQSLRAAGKGMPAGNGQRGDMMVEVTFSPEKLSTDERQVLEELRTKRKA